MGPSKLSASHEGRMFKYVKVLIGVCERRAVKLQRGLLNQIIHSDVVSVWHTHP